MLTKTPLKRKTPLKSKTALKSKTPLKGKTSLKQRVEEVIGPVAKGVRIHKPKRKPNYMLDLDSVFQFYVRLRDCLPGGYCRCITCGKMYPFDKIQAGHFMSRRHMSLRWNELNVNAECCFDNCWNSDHQFAYEQNLIRKIGKENVDWLKASVGDYRKWSDFEMIQMIQDYSAKTKVLSKQKGVCISKHVMDIIRRYEKK